MTSKEMKIKESYPPNYEIIKLTLNPPPHAVFCYGDTIHNPSKRELLPDLIHHEEVHSKQQDNNPDLWYNRYLTDKDFRLDQELEAYASQYNFIKDKLNAKLRKWLLGNKAEALSRNYKLSISQREAESKIRNYAKN